MYKCLHATNTAGSFSAPDNHIYERGALYTVVLILIDFSFGRRALSRVLWPLDWQAEPNIFKATSNAKLVPTAPNPSA